MGGYYEGFLVGRDRVHISHLQFADDILIFCKDNDGMLDNLIKAIKAYERMSGFSVNWEKSTICGINIPSEKVLQNL